MDELKELVFKVFYCAFCKEHERFKQYEEDGKKEFLEHIASHFKSGMELDSWEKARILKEE